jgi:Cu-Zn family superoxide dismutase
MHRAAAAAFLSLGSLALVAGCAGGDQALGATAQQEQEPTTAPAEAAEAPDHELTASLVDAAGHQVGEAEFSEEDGGTEVSVHVTGLPQGFHGLHVHAVGVCDANSADPADPAKRGDFLSAGGHVGVGRSDHGSHPGDLPVLYVTASGTGSLTAVTDAFSLADLTDADGSAVVVHAGPDDYGNIPARYAPGGPDAVTRSTGDAGARLACGVVRS